MYWFFNFFLVGPRRHFEALSEVACVLFFTFLPLVVLNIKNLAPTEERDLVHQILTGVWFLCRMASCSCSHSLFSAHSPC